MVNLEFAAPPGSGPELSRALDLYRRGHYPQAEAECRALLLHQPAQTQALHLLGLILADRGVPAQALACIEQALHREPQNAALLGTRALLLLRTARLEEAEQAARAALALRPELADVLDILGSIRWQRGDLDAARDCFTRALRQTPGHPGAWDNLALLNERSNRVADAERMADEGLTLRPQDVTLRLTRGRCLRRRGAWAEARAQFAGLTGAGTTILQRDVEYELAGCADAEGDFDAAFAHAEHANHLARQLAPAMLKDARDFMVQIHGLQARFTAQWVAGWTALPAAGDAPRPAFLLGFPRSGTTLLDSMLGAHPDVSLLEESATEQVMVAALDRMPGGYPETLGTLSPEQNAVVLQAYRQAAAMDSDSRHRVLDKSPFMTVHLGLLARVFPHAPILFVARHPCDVVISCFLTGLELNSGTVHFTRLGSTVDLYCSIMDLRQHYLDALPLHLHQVRYEDLLDRPEATLRAALAFLGLPWSDAVLKHADFAARRTDLKSASYAQVTRPLYQHSRERWRHYAKYLEPYLPRLRPYCDLFGYSL